MTINGHKAVTTLVYDQLKHIYRMVMPAAIRATSYHVALEEMPTGEGAIR